MITKKSIMIKYLFLFIPIIAFSQSRDYKNKVKSPSYSFLTEIEINKTRYLEDYILKATKLGYELLRNNDGEVITKTGPTNSILLKKSVDNDEHFPPWAFGDIYKKVFFLGDNIEGANPLCVITEIFLIEYENLSQTTIKNFYSSTSDFILKHINFYNKINSTKITFDKPLQYLRANINKYPFVNMVNYSYVKNGFEFKNSFSYSERSERVNGNDGKPYSYHYLGFQNNSDIWDNIISLYEGYEDLADNKRTALENLRDNIGDKNIKEINTYDLHEMVQFFIDDCKRSNIIVPSIETLSATFKPLEEGVIALAYGMNNDNQIFISVDPKNWDNSDITKKWYVIYHELGHDVLNLDHGEGGKMMFNFADREYTWDEFYKDKDYMFDYVLNRQVKKTDPPSLTLDIDSKTYSIGDFVNGGVVFWLDSTGQHGLVCALSDSAINAEWGCYDYDLPNVPNVQYNGGYPEGSGTEIGDGFNNTNNILNDCPTSPAALAARSLGKDWFLPSTKELNQMYINKRVLERFPGFVPFSGVYHTSTENSIYNTWKQNFGKGNLLNSNKFTKFSVRAVRAF